MYSTFTFGFHNSSETQWPTCQVWVWESKYHHGRIQAWISARCYTTDIMSIFFLPVHKYGKFHLAGTFLLYHTPGWLQFSDYALTVRMFWIKLNKIMLCFPRKKEWRYVLMRAPNAFCRFSCQLHSNLCNCHQQTHEAAQYVNALTWVSM